MSANQAKKIEVEVQDVKPIHPTDITLQYSIGSFASSYMTYAPGDTEAMKKALSPTSKNILDDLKKSQELSFTTSQRWASINIKGEGLDTEDFSFGGYVNCPTYMFSVNNVSATEHVIADCSSMNSIDLSIYKIEVSYLKDNAIVTSPKDDLADTIAKISEFFLKEADKETSEDKTVTKSINDIDSANKRNSSYFTQLFYNSHGEMGWDKLPKTLGQSAWFECVGRIINILQSNTGGFFNTLLQLADEFQCIYVPSDNGEDPGKFVNKSKIFDNPEVITLNIISLQASLGYSGMNPVAAVAVVSPEFPRKYLRDVPATKTMVTYPEGDAVSSAGSILQVPGPPWLSASVYEEFDEIEAKENAKKDNQSIGSRREDRSKAEGKLKEKIPTVVELLKQWAKAEYYWQCLGQTSCVVNCEFTKLEVGKYYMVYSEEGELLFSGILYSISHRISSDANSASADSILNFSHVRISDANIPGLK